jgi:iron complex transport system substrate-binding protein
MQEQPLSRATITRRRFLQAGTVAAAGLALGSLSGCDTFDEMLTGERSIIDDVGRTVTIPTVDKLERVYFTSALAEIFCFTVAPDLMGGTCSQYDANQLQYLPESMADLSYMGSLSSGGTVDREALIYNDIQLIFSISGTDLSDVNISDAEKLQDQTGIPVVLIDGSFDIIGESYRFLGQILGRETRANALASYLEAIYERVTAAVAQVPESERKSYYYAEGPEGIQTEPDASQHSLAFQVAGGQNVVTGVSPTANGGMSDVSLESVIGWDPEYIITWDLEDRGGAEKIIRTSSEWDSIRAVQEGKVYTMPDIPFAFCDRPPGVNRFMGIQWLANIFYPEYYDIDMVAMTQEFYSTCYWRDITEDQARSILMLD